MKLCLFFSAVVRAAGRRMSSSSSPTISVTVISAATARRSSARRISTAWRRRGCASRTFTPLQRSARRAEQPCSRGDCPSAAACAETAGCSFRTPKAACHRRRSPSPRRLKDKGYATMHIGKWHLGIHAGSRPLDQGFRSQLRPALLERHGWPSGFCRKAAAARPIRRMMAGMWP
jgi:hypothetical protein